MTKIGYLGPPSSFSEKAAKKVLADEYVPFSTIPDLLQAFWDKEIDEAVLPMNNSTEGIVGLTSDGLIIENGNNFSIKEEIILPIKQNLIGVSLECVVKVFSHSQALAQCSKHLRGMKVEIENYSSTSAAVEFVAKSNNPKFAAIGTIQAAEKYGLEVLAENIQDFENNETRFIVLGRSIRAPTGNDKTSLVFEVLENKAGALFDVLEVLKVSGINMTKLTSRPLKTGLDDDVFWVDIDGHQDDPKISDALKEIKKRTAFLKVLGSYPKEEV